MMPWNPELINTKVSIYRESRAGPGGDEVGSPVTVALEIPAHVEYGDRAVQLNAPVPTSSESEKVDLWIEGVDGNGDVIDVKRFDRIEWLTFSNVLSDRWQVDAVRPYAGPLAHGVPTLDHIKIEARP